MDARDLNVLQTHGKNAAAWNVFPDPQSCAVRSPSVEPVFFFFFMQADLVKCKKKILILQTIIMKWDIVSGLFFFFHYFSWCSVQKALWTVLFDPHLVLLSPFSFLSLCFLFCFVSVMPFACSSNEYLHWLQQMEISQYKVCRGSSGCIVSCQWQSVGCNTLHWKLWVGR